MIIYYVQILNKIKKKKENMNNNENNNNYYVDRFKPKKVRNASNLSIYDKLKIRASNINQKNSKPKFKYEFKLYK